MYLMFVMVLLIFSCDLFEDTYNYSLFGNHTLYYIEDFDRLDTIKDVSVYIRRSIRYSLGNGYQDPKVTFETSRGNCTSFTFAYMNTLYYSLGIKSNAIVVKYSNSRSIVGGGGDGNHVIVELPDGTQIEPQNGMVKHYEVLYRYTFDEVF